MEIPNEIPLTKDYVARMDLVSLSSRLIVRQIKISPPINGESE